jgi:hypothetical protein
MKIRNGVPQNAGTTSGQYVLTACRSFQIR